MTILLDGRYNDAVPNINHEDDFIYADDMVVGAVMPYGEYTFTEEEMIAFGRRWDPLPMHVDPEAAATGHYGGLIASSIHTLAAHQRLSVTASTRWKIIAGAGFNNIRLLRPVRPGDTLTGGSEILAVELQPERWRGRVQMQGRLLNQTGKDVLTMTIDAYMHMRGAPTA